MGGLLANVGHHNRVLEKAAAKAQDMEGRMARVLKPILDGAGEEAARNFSRLATDHLTASAWLSPATLAHMAAEKLSGAALSASLALRGAGPGVQSNSTMIALKPRQDEALRLAEISDGALDPETLHVTLAYLGEWDGDLAAIGEALMQTAAGHAPLEGAVGGIGVFAGGPDGRPNIALPSVPGLVELRVTATAALVERGFDYSRDYGYLPHMTISYTDQLEQFPSLGLIGEPLHFDDLWVVRGDVDTIQIPFTGVAPLTAAGRRPQWGAPAGDELVNVDRLVGNLRTKSDPVRAKVVETTMKSTLDGAGIDFDVTNPFTAKVLSHSGEQITNIAATTRQNATNIVAKSYEEGLSIPDTATALRAGMRDASVVRATLIARTELTGAVNGGSLAATQIVDEVLGGGAFMKQWLTASGAVFPRHEMYEGLNGQETTLDGFFFVGGDELQYPGDPGGSPEEVCNCRCTIVYTESGNQVAEGDADTGGYTADDLAAEMAADSGGGDLAIGDVSQQEAGPMIDEVMPWPEKQQEVAGSLLMDADDPNILIQSARNKSGELEALVGTTPATSGDRTMILDLAAKGGTGAGTKLLEHVARQATEKGHGLQLAALDKEAEAYWAKQGFERLGGGSVRLMDLSPEKTKMLGYRNVAHKVEPGGADVARARQLDNLTNPTPSDRMLADILREDSLTLDTAVVRQDGVVVAAVQTRYLSDGTIEVVNIASTVPRAGTEMMSAVAQDAAEQGVGVVLQPTEGSVGFYERLGMRLDEQGRFRWTPDEARRFAGDTGRPLPPPPLPPVVLPPPVDPGLLKIINPDEERPYSHWAKSTLDRQIVKSRTVVRKALEKDPTLASLTPKEILMHDRHKEKLQLLLRERDLRKGIVEPRPAEVVAPKVVATPVTQTHVVAGDRMSRIKDAYANRPAVDDRDSKVFLNPEAAEAELRKLGQDVADEIEARLAESPTAFSPESSFMISRRRNVLLDVLREVRATGRNKALKAPRQLKSVTANNVRDLVFDNHRWYPRDWLEAARKSGSVKYRKAPRGYFKAGYKGTGYSGSAHTIAVSMEHSFIAGDAPGMGTAVHELAHLMEHSNPSVLRAERAFYERRTAGEELVPLSSGVDEKAREDEFLHPYIGREYYGQAYEVLSMGMESLVSGKTSMWTKDLDMRNFILGVLVGL